MTAGKRIALNVAATYGRSLVSMAFGLFSCRWVLQALGTSDFGLYAIVGSLTAFAVFFGNLLQVSVTRHLAFALGRDGEGGVRDWFAMALVIHLMLALLVALAGFPLGEWIIGRFVDMPPDRVFAARIVFRLSMFSLAVTTVGIPFGAYFTAHQRMVEPAIFGMLQTAFVFGSAGWLLGYCGDRLIAYGVLMCAGTVMVQVVQALWAIRKWHLSFDFRRLGPSRAKAILSFAGWNAFGGGGWMVAVRGSDFVTNRFFGPVGNAAYGIAQQLQGQAESLANALIGAFTPALTERYGFGDAEGSRQLALQSCFIGAVLLAIFSLPLTVEMDFVLKLWLRNPPEDAGEVCVIMLAVSLFNKLTMGQQMAIAAEGRIAAWQIVSGISQTLALPLAYAFAAFGLGLRSAAVAYAVVFLGCFFSNLHFGLHIAGISVRSWLRCAACPFLLVTTVAAVAALVPHLWLTAGFARLVLVSAFTSAVFLPGIWLWKRLT